MRTSVDDPNSLVETTVSATGNISDFQAVDDTPGVFMTLSSLLIKIWWLVFFALCAAALSFPYLFPQWAEKYHEQLDEMGIAANTGNFIKNARQVDWKTAFSRVNFDNLLLVGTGRHPQFKTTPGLKTGTWYTGQVFIMKSYVTEHDWLKITEDFEGEAVADLLLPMSEVDHAEATAYCENQGGRLPSYEQLSLAYYFAFNKSWQGKTGSILKPNLVFNINNSYSLWTSTAEGTGFLKSDNFRVFTSGVKNQRYEDNGFESSKLSFLCVKDELKK